MNTIGSISNFDSSLSLFFDHEILGSTWTSAVVNTNSQINDIKRLFNCKEQSVIDKLLCNHDLISFLTNTIATISATGIMFTADLEVVEDDIYDDNNKLLLIYRPYQITKNTNISIPDGDRTLNKSLYRQIIKELFKYSINVRKSVIVDEQ